MKFSGEYNSKTRLLALSFKLAGVVFLVVGAFGAHGASPLCQGYDATEEEIAECERYVQQQETQRTFQDGAFDPGAAFPPAKSKGVEYFALAPIPGVPRTTTDLSAYLTGLFRVLVVAAGILAVVMIVIGGFQYLSTEALGGKEEGRARITNALMGLLLLALAIPLLQLLNPQLLQFKLGLVDITLDPAAVPKLSTSEEIKKQAAADEERASRCAKLVGEVSSKEFAQECSGATAVTQAILQRDAIVRREQTAETCRESNYKTRYRITKSRSGNGLISPDDSRMTSDLRAKYKELFDRKVATNPTYLGNPGLVQVYYYECGNGAGFVAY